VRRKWNETHFANAKRASETKDVDVLFFGDSITEGWMGTYLSKPLKELENVPPTIFAKYFDSKFKGLALGISGDMSRNLLWRLQNGELPETIHPKVIWVLIGTSDVVFFGKSGAGFRSAWCSAELVVVGIVRVLEELRHRKPDAMIVVNGLLPRAFHPEGHVAAKKSTTTATDFPPLYTDQMITVNKELSRYANAHDKVHYFESEVFWVDKNVPTDDLKINLKLMPDMFHPSADGYDAWGAEILQELENLIG